MKTPQLRREIAKIKAGCITHAGSLIDLEGQLASQRIGAETRAHYYKLRNRLKWADNEIPESLMGWDR